MTIVNTQVTITYAGNGTTTSFPVPFPFFGPDELGVYRQDAAGTQTTLTRGVDYTVSGGAGATGTVVTGLAPASDITLIIRRRTARTQQVEYDDFDPFPATTHETALDRLTAQGQEADESQNRSIRKAIGHAAIAALPAGTGFGMWLSFDASGNPIYAAPSAGTVPISAAMQPLVAAGTLPAFWQAAGEVQGYSTTYGQFRLVGPANYGVLLRNDDTAFYILQTASGARFGGWTTLRPFKFLLGSGAVTIDETGAGVTFGGNLAIGGTATTSVTVTGTHTRGIDTTGATISGQALRMGNSQFLSWMNAAGSGTINDQVDNANFRHIGGNSAGIVAGASIIPLIDNAVPLGVSTNRWSAVWAVNGTIQTSDPRLKRDIADLPATLPLVLGIRPITFRWDQGGQEPVDDMEFQEVAVTELRHETQHVIEIRDGQPVMTMRSTAQEVAVTDLMPVLDEAGAPVTTTDAAGNEVPLLHEVPRMERRAVPVRRWEPRPGQRVHWGFDARQVQQVMARSGRDFGGFVLAEDGTAGLRPDQLLPVLWKAVQELAAELAILKQQRPGNPEPQE